MFLLPVEAAVAVVLAMEVLEAVVPVAVARSSCTVASSSLTEEIAASREVTWVVKEAFSEEVQVTVTLVTDLHRVEILVEAGFWSVRVMMVVMAVTTEAQEEAVARELELVELLLVRLEAVALAAVRPAELSVRALAFCRRDAEDWEQAEMAFRPSSSYVLHREKFALQ